MKKAVVMGASSGIGMEVAKLLLADGWEIGVAARRTDLLEQLKETAPERVTTAAIDVNADGAEDLLLSLIATPLLNELQESVLLFNGTYTNSSAEHPR